MLWQLLPTNKTIKYVEGVKFLQAALKSLGYGNLRIDGDFGTETKSALILFLKENNISPDGRFGDKVRAALITGLNQFKI